MFTAEPIFEEASTNTRFYRALCNHDSCELYVDLDGNKCPSGCECASWNVYFNVDIKCKKFEFVAQINKLPDAFRGGRSLYIENLNLTQLPNKTIYGNSSPLHLYAANNKLDDLTTAQLPEDLIDLNIKNNSLKFLRPEVIKFFEKRRDTMNVEMSGNPWVCDCYEQNFLTFLDRNHKFINDFEDIRCGGITPAEKREICRLRLIYLVWQFPSLLCV